MSLKQRLLRLALALAACTSALAQTAAQKLPSTGLTAGIHVIQAEVARTPEQRATGLMFRRDMGPNEGMLFVFERAGTQCFWMRNTFLPLTIAFLADDGRIVNLDDMKPQTETSHCSSEPVRHVLEMNQGWFARRGLKPGDRLQGDPFRR